MKKEEIEKKEKWSELNEKMENLNMDETEKEKIKRDILHKEAEQMRLKFKKTLSFVIFPFFHKNSSNFFIFYS